VAKEYQVIQVALVPVVVLSTDGTQAIITTAIYVAYIFQRSIHGYIVPHAQMGIGTSVGTALILRVVERRRFFGVRHTMR